MRLIDADKLKERLFSEADYEIVEEVFAFQSGWNDALKSVMQFEPTVDPVKHGHWDNKIIDTRFDVPHTVARCSNCKGKIWVYEENYEVKYPYCSLCGAKMDEVTDGSPDN